MPSPEIRPVNPLVWRAIAGLSFHIPVVNSRVYYFPQGHAEHCSSSPEDKLSGISISACFFHCVVHAVDLLIDSQTDEAYVKMVLNPVSPNHSGGNPKDLQEDNRGRGDEEDGIVSYVKCLTRSDSNNGGGFSVPRSCADSVFPALDLTANMPAQTLKIADVKGYVREFRHIYRGMPRRHLLTTGWSKFVNAKKIVAGDSVVFMRTTNGDLFTGLRRVDKPIIADNDIEKLKEEIGGKSSTAYGGDTDDMTEEEQEVQEKVAGKVPAESMVKSLKLAMEGSPFEVTYYPKPGRSQFVIKAEMVENAMRVVWRKGIRVEMGIDFQDSSSSKKSWVKGTVSSVKVPVEGPWQGSAWRVLEVEWDQYQVKPYTVRVSPWEVELVEQPRPFPEDILLARLHKRFKLPFDYELLPEGEDTVNHVHGLTFESMGHFNPELLSYNIPVGMQGARQSSCYFREENGQKSVDIPAELSTGNSNNSNSPPYSQSDLHFSVRVNPSTGAGSMQAGSGSIKLFGKIIHVEEAIERPSGDIGSREDVTRRNDETEGISKPLNPLFVLSMYKNYLIESMSVARWPQLLKQDPCDSI